MADNVNLSINGQSHVPPGFRFHPTEEELLHYYLRKKVCYQRIDLDVIPDVDLNKLEPWDIQEKCRIGSTPQNDWYFFSHKDKKYPTGTRTNRATAAGFWKATGRDKIIYSGARRIGLRKTLVFYRGRAPHGQKSDWIMHEYRLDDNSITSTTNGSDVVMTDSANSNEEGWVVCRVFRKKNYQKIIDGPTKLGVDHMGTETFNPGNNGVLDHILLYMGRSGSSSTCESENGSNVGKMRNSGDDDNERVMLHERFMIHLPRLHETVPRLDDRAVDGLSSMEQVVVQSYKNDDNSPVMKTAGDLSNWASVERLVAWQLNNGDHHHQTDHKSSPDDHQNLELEDEAMQRWNGLHWHGNYEDMDIWNSLTESSSSPSSLDPLGHLSI